MPMFYDESEDYTFFLRIHPVIKMHFRLKGWSCLYRISEYCGVHIEDLCRACEISIGKDELDFCKSHIAIYARLGLTAADLLRMIEYKEPPLRLTQGGSCEYELSDKLPP